MTREERNARRRELYWQNHEQMLEYSRQYRANMTEYQKKRVREQKRKCRQRHLDEYRARGRARYYERKKEKLNEEETSHRDNSD